MSLTPAWWGHCSVWGLETCRREEQTFTDPADGKELAELTCLLTFSLLMHWKMDILRIIPGAAIWVNADVQMCPSRVYPVLVALPPRVGVGPGCRGAAPGAFSPPKVHVSPAYLSLSVACVKGQLRIISKPDSPELRLNHLSMMLLLTDLISTSVLLIDQSIWNAAYNINCRLETVWSDAQPFSLGALLLVSSQCSYRD